MPANISNNEALNISGNAAADQLATDTFVAHPAFLPKRLALAKHDFHLAQQVCHLAALALPLWKQVEGSGKLSLRSEILEARARKKSSKPPAVLEPLLTPADGGHCWLEFGDCYRCCFCPLRTTKKKRARDSTTTCPRNLGKLGEVLAKAKETGHKLFWSVHQRSGLRVLSCNICDSYATVAPKGLLE